MAVQTGDKKLDGNGLAIVWGLVKTLYNNLAGVVETNRIKQLGGVETLSLTAKFEKNSLISCANVIYLSSATVTGLPTNIVTEDSAMVLDDGEVVVDGDNTESKWVYVCGRTIDRSPQSDSESLVTSGGLYGALETKADVSDLDGYINNCQYNNDTDNIELMHDDKVICTVGVGKAITTAMQSLVERVALIESRYVYEE